jgi:hypothetical protein
MINPGQYQRRRKTQSLVVLMTLNLSCIQFIQME